jgi:hypothetical protein
MAELLDTVCSIIQRYSHTVDEPHGSLISSRVLRICNTLYFLSLHHFHNLL